MPDVLSLAFYVALAGLFFVLLDALVAIVSWLRRLTASRGLEAQGDRQFREEVFPDELDHLAARQAAAGSARPPNPPGTAPSAERGLVGLALSGGGIRSATLNLGVLQSLERLGLLRHVDYLSTVSGGGFIGGALTALTSTEEAPDEPPPFPFASHRQREPQAVAYLRNNSNYLAPRGALDWLRMILAWVRGFLLNGLVILPWLIFLAAIVSFFVYPALRAAHVPHQIVREADVLDLLPGYYVEQGIEIPGQIWSRLRTAEEVFSEAESRLFPEQLEALYGSLSATLEGYPEEDRAAFYRSVAATVQILPSAQLADWYLVYSAPEREVSSVHLPETLNARSAEPDTLSEEAFAAFYAAAMAPQSELSEARMGDSRRDFFELRTSLELGQREVFESAFDKAITTLDEEAFVALMRDLSEESLNQLAGALTARESEALTAGIASVDWPGGRLRDLYRTFSARRRLPPPERIESLFQSRLRLIRSGMPAQDLVVLGRTWWESKAHLSAATTADRQRAEPFGRLLRQQALDTYLSQLEAGESPAERTGRRGEIFTAVLEEAAHLARYPTFEVPVAAAATASGAEIEEESEAPRAATDSFVLLDCPGMSAASFVHLGRYLPRQERPHPFRWQLLSWRVAWITLLGAGPLFLLLIIVGLGVRGVGGQRAVSAAIRMAASLLIFVLLIFGLFLGIERYPRALGFAVMLVLLTPLLAYLLDRLLGLSLSRRLADGGRAISLEVRDLAERLSIVVLLSAAGAVLIVLQAPIIDFFHHLAWPVDRQWLLAAPLVVVVLAALAGASTLGRTVRKVGMLLLVVLGPLLLFLIYLAMTDILVFGTPVIAADRFFNARSDWAVVLLLGLLAYRLPAQISANASSAHGFYRDRLAKAFLIGRDTDGVIGPEDELPLANICPPAAGGPYLLINVALNLQGSKDESLRGRNSGFFILSRSFVGGSHTGYCRPEELAWTGSPLSLSTAVAVSAAAAAPNMGVYTPSGVSSLMTLLNARLGFWLPHPARVRRYRELDLEAHEDLKPRSLARRLASWFRRGWLRAGGNLLWREMLGNLDERGQMVYVSDGGHLENLGLYELLRRRCRYLIVSDAESDPDFRFGGLAALLRYARLDLGIEVDIHLKDLRPDALGCGGQHAAIGLVRYPATGDAPAETGYLLYLKAALTGDEDEVIQEYHARRPDFPHQSTSDQFFSESQFEAYRSLGEHALGSLWDVPHPAPGDRSGEIGYDALERWFQDLLVQLAPSRFDKVRVADVESELAAIDRLLARTRLRGYFEEIYGTAGADGAAAPPADPEASADLLSIVTRQLRLMEQVFHDLRFNQRAARDHPGNRGWIKLFRRWATTPSFRYAYGLSVPHLSPRFQFFCERVLGLKMKLSWVAGTKGGDAPRLELAIEGEGGRPLGIGRLVRGEPDRVEIDPAFDLPLVRRRAEAALGDMAESDREEPQV